MLTPGPDIRRSTSQGSGDLDYNNNNTYAFFLMTYKFSFTSSREPCKSILSPSLVL